MTKKHKVNLKVADDVIIIRTRDLKKNSFTSNKMAMVAKFSRKIYLVQINLMMIIRLSMYDRKIYSKKLQLLNF